MSEIENKDHRLNTRIPISTKIAAIEYAKKTNNQKASEKFGVSSKSIRRWRKNENQFKDIPKPNKKITIHKGPPNKINVELENEIYKWICFNRDLGNPITTWSICIEFIKRDPTKKDLKPKSLYNYIYRFMERYRLSIRQKTHVGQLLPSDSIDKIYMFLKEIIRIRKEYDIPLSNIVNFDETALSYNIPPNKTVHHIGQKTIVIRTLKQEKARISLILSINAAGEKLKPYIIFKGAKSGKIYHDLINNGLVKKKLCEISCNANAWATKEIILNWINKIYVEKFKNINLQNTLLILDSAAMHISLDIIRYLVSLKINYVFIPKGLTSILQPLDVSVNRPFKDALRHCYENALSIFNQKKMPKIKREVLMKWIIDSWYNNTIIKSDVIVKSFLVTGISNNLDGSEDEEFNGFEKVYDIGFIEDDFTENDKEDNNNIIDINSSEDSEEGSSDREIDKE